MMTEEKIISVLLVDDDQDDRLLFSNAIKSSSMSCKLLLAQSCDDALEKLKGTKVAPDFMFVDLNMPDTDGFECLKKIRSNSMWASAKVFIYSTSSNIDFVEKARMLGADGYIKKPNDFGDMCSNIEKIITMSTASSGNFISQII